MSHVVKEDFRIVNLQQYAKHLLYNRYIMAYFELSLLIWTIIPLRCFKPFYSAFIDIYFFQEKKLFNNFVF